MRKVLSLWKKENNVNSNDNIKQIHIALELEQSSSYPILNHVRYLKKESMLAYKEEEAYWSQKCSDHWFLEGDRNTKYFHASVKANRGKKRLEKLKDENGIFQRYEGSKGEVAVKYFQDLFTSSSPSNFSDLFQGFTPKVYEAMNAQLIKEVTSEKIKEVVFSVKAASGPGPDGMSGLFQRYWILLAKKLLRK